MQTETQPTQQSAGPIETMAQFDALLGTLNQTPTEDPAPAPAPAEGTPAATTVPTGATPTEPPAPATDPDPAPVDPAITKQANAFAQLRVQNKKYNDVLQTILRRAGMDTALASDLNSLQQALDDAETQQQASQMQVPPELLKRLNQLEQTNAQFEQQRLHNAAIAGFQTLQHQFKLTDKQVMDFAKQLHDNEINPFVTELDLVREYKLMNFDEIQNKRIESAVQEALAKQTTAQQRSTAPTATVSRPDNGNSESKITDMAGFDRFLKDNRII